MSDHRAGPRPTERAPVRLHEDPARHFARHWPGVALLLRPALRDTGQLDHAAQCTDGVLDFTIDARPELREALRQVDQQLAFTANRLDRRLAEARSGDLIRVVLQTERAAFYCDNVVPGRHLLGALLLEPAAAQPGAHPEGQPAVDGGDQDLARIVSSLRGLLNLGTLDIGGFGTAVVGEPAAAAPVPADQIHTGGDRDDPRLPPCRDALSVENVHFLTYCRHGERLFAVDILDHDDLARFFTLVDVDVRRRFYDTLAEEFGAICGSLSRAIHPVVDATLTRAVLDVEQGAVYYFRIRRGEYLVGVTLNQRRVSAADTVINALADSLRKLLAPAAAPAGRSDGDDHP